MSLESSAPDPHDARTAADFVAQLRRLKAWSGLTYRELEKEAAKHGYALPHSTIASALKRESLPREELVKGLVTACGCPDDTVAAWTAVRRALAVGEHPTPRSAAEPAPGADTATPFPAEPVDPTEDAVRSPDEPPAAPAGAPPPHPMTHPHRGEGLTVRLGDPRARSRPARRRAGLLAPAGALAAILLVVFAVSVSSRAIPEEPKRPSVPAAAPPLPTPAGWWRFEETGGRTALDSSGHGLHLRISGDATRTTAPSGHALSLGGNGHAVADRPVINTNAAFTITAWVLLAETRRAGTVIAAHHTGDAPDVVLLTYDAEHTDWALMVPDRVSSWANGNETAYGGRRPVAGRWTHLAAVFDPADRQLCLYVDGEPGSCRKRTKMTRAGGPLDIGRALLKGSPIDGWQGAIDDVRVFAMPLSPRQVRQVAAQRT
ncbi:hypothetical protein NE236_41840 [Actinoallomurus purpureus]|uniref:LamG domain-containing protein n=1 Tax=Actinoallomurus purpureus TaxID=478114 RepID=UPI00209255B7|nr:LamG domain-containing protein [Actinoallomurus purpureus]MCO6011513.1 hypothetical protein [Actinoallomurus purpureus]